MILFQQQFFGPLIELLLQSKINIHSRFRPIHDIGYECATHYYLVTVNTRYNLSLVAKERFTWGNGYSGSWRKSQFVFIIT